MDISEVEALNRLLEVASCPVCTERLPPSVRCCVNGHAICDKCGQSVTTCPTCRGPFSTEKTISFSEVLAALPGQCKHPGCEKIKYNIQEHEKYCTFRKTSCQACEWEGSVMELNLHVESDHPSMMVSSLKFNWSIDVNKPGTNKYLCKINEEFFWIIEEVNLNKNVFSTQFICVPMQKVVSVVYMSIEFKNDQIVNMIKIKLSFEPTQVDSEENRLSFSMDMLKQFDQINGFVQFQITLEKKPEEVDPPTNIEPSITCNKPKLKNPIKQATYISSSVSVNKPKLKDPINQATNIRSNVSVNTPNEQGMGIDVNRIIEEYNESLRLEWSNAYSNY